MRYDIDNYILKGIIRMKRSITILLTAILAVFLFACSLQEEVNPGEQAEEYLTEGENTKCEVTYSQYSGTNRDIFLKEGDKIAVISPSALPSREQTDAVIKGLKDWGYEPVEGKHVCAEIRTLDEILEDLEWALENPEIKAIFCVRGGYGASEVADRLSPQLIQNAHKLIIGYSDITVYHSAWTANGVPSIHACMSGTFGDFPQSCFEAEEKILKGEIPTYKCEGSSYNQTGEADGVLIGGNLSTFLSVIGSAYDCTKSGQPYILFFEDVGEDVQHIHRYLTILKHTGVLDNAAGIVFGEWTELPMDLGDYSGSSRGGEYKSIADMISRQLLTDIDVPVAFGFPAGHGDINYPLLMGEKARLKVDPDSFTLTLGAE
jgi:muramoyltetrapeptide carboxypeptidase